MKLLGKFMKKTKGKILLGNFFSIFVGIVLAGAAVKVLEELEGLKQQKYLWGEIYEVWGLNRWGIVYQEGRLVTLNPCNSLGLVVW